MTCYFRKTLTAITFAAATLLPVQALAHAHLTSASPAANAVMHASPQDITLTFSEGLEASFSHATLTDAQGARVKTGSVALRPGSKNVLQIPLINALAKGQYQVNWRVLSVDGHKTKGVYTFTVG